MSLIKDKYLVCRNILTNDQRDLLLHGDFSYESKLSKRRRIIKQWSGCCSESFKNCNFVKLQDGRIDVSLPLEILNELKLDIFDKLNLTGYKVVNCNLLINPPNPNIQEWHQDNGGLDPEDYYTLLIPLTDHEKIGKTEVQQPYSYDFKKNAKIVTPKVTVGDGLLFSGCLWHRGMPNNSKITRYCLYFIIVKNNVDLNKIFEGWK